MKLSKILPSLRVLDDLIMLITYVDDIDKEVLYTRDPELDKELRK